VYHVELRQFPHNLCRFNLSDEELGAIVTSWVLERPLELGERKWNAQQATMTVLEGPRLGLQQLAMGRGWRAAQRQSQDVTERVIADARETLVGARSAERPPAPGPPAGGSSPGIGGGGAPQAPSTETTAVLGDPLALGVALASLLGPDPGGLLAAWRRAAAEHPGLSPSEALALAEQAVGSARSGSG
jgi:hypothetical protein